mgnify:CR=1 FL=1
MRFVCCQNCKGVNEVDERLSGMTTACKHCGGDVQVPLKFPNWQLTAEKTKECPYCAETIQAKAVKCKHCGEAIAKDAWRIVLAREVTFGSQVRTAPINVHTGCVQAELRSEDCQTEVEGFEEQIRQHSDLEASALDEALAEIGDLDG